MTIWNPNLLSRSTTSHDIMRIMYAEFSDPHLVAIYDTVNPIEEYINFYLELAAKLKVKTIIDIGCGTGLLTYELDKGGYQMIGVEPSHAMLEVAKKRKYTKNVQWIHGDATHLINLWADLAIMTGHVFQFFLEDESLNKNLKAIYNALNPGGHLAFESRNPKIMPFDTWPTENSRRKLIDPEEGEIEWWVNKQEKKDERVRYEIHYLFTKSGEELVSMNELVFRTQEEITQTLSDKGFALENVYGNWDSSPVTSTSPELIFITKKI